MRKNNGANLNTLVFGPVEVSGSLVRRTAALTRDEAVDIGKKFAERFRALVDEKSLIFLFGSAVKGGTHTESDIDVAVVSAVFDGDFFAEAGRASSLAQSVSGDIEVHAVNSTDWRRGDPHVLEILKWGIAL